MQMGLFETRSIPEPDPTRADEIETAARVFVKNHPAVWELFVKFTHELIAVGRQNYGAKSVVERIRWHTAVQGDEDFKINNNHTAVFARWFEQQYPKHQGFFRMRERTSEAKVPRNRPDQTTETT